MTADAELVLDVEARALVEHFDETLADGGLEVGHEREEGLALHLFEAQPEVLRARLVHQQDGAVAREVGDRCTPRAEKRLEIERSSHRDERTMGSPHAEPLTLFISTRKGLWTLRTTDRSRFDLAGPAHLGHMVHHTVLDPRDRRTLLAGVRTGHLGPVVNAIARRRQDLEGSLATAGVSEGRAAGARRRSRSGSRLGTRANRASGTPVRHRRGSSAATTAVTRGVQLQDTTITLTRRSGPVATRIRRRTAASSTRCSSIRATRSTCTSACRVVASSSRPTKAPSWKPLSLGVENHHLPKLPNGEEYTSGDDPHCVALHPLRPDRLWQQNHFGIYRLDRDQGERWKRVGRAMPKEIGDIGFPIALHPREPDTAWVFPMDGTDAWPRVSPSGRPALHVTRDAGESWQRQDTGFPRDQAWWTVKRQAMISDFGDPVGLYLGTTNGEVWHTADEGRTFACIARHLPHIYALSSDSCACILVPFHLRSYTGRELEVQLHGATLADVLVDSEARFKGIRHRVVDEQDRIRPHVKFFVGGDEVEVLETPVGEREVQIVAALSGAEALLEPKLEVPRAFDRVLGVGLDVVKPERFVERDRHVHLGDGIEPHRAVAGGASLAHDRARESATASVAVERGTDEESFHLADAVAEVPERDASRDGVVDPREQEPSRRRCVPTG